jgi:hypothetical protein
MYLNKQKRTNIEGDIAWLEQQDPEQKSCYNKDILRFLKSIVED